MHHHDHSHAHEANDYHGRRKGNKTGLTVALLITAAIMVMEFVGGLLTNSLALLSDSGHMLSDTSSLALSLFAMWIAARPPSTSKTYGFYRFEILAALFNGLSLFVIAGFIIWEAYDRFFAPPDVSSGYMMLIALIGLVANLASAWVLMRQGDVKDNVNLRSAYLHILGDAIGSVGAILAGLLIYFFSWNIADPIISVVVALLILKSAWGVIDQTIHVLMEGTPATIDASEVADALRSIPGVKSVHDLHIWTITSGLDSLSCHIVIENESISQQILQTAIGLSEDKFSIQHTTLQIETDNLKHAELVV